MATAYEDDEAHVTTDGGASLSTPGPRYQVELLKIMITSRFLDFIVGNNRLPSIFGSIDHNSMIVAQDEDQNVQLDHEIGVH